MIRGVFSFLILTSVFVNSEKGGGTIKFTLTNKVYDNVENYWEDLEFAKTVSQIKSSPRNEDFTFFVEKMSLVARIVTGISLQLGLIDGSIPSEEVISELLNIGMSLKDLEKFEKSQVDDFLEKLEGARAKLSTESEITGSLIDLQMMKEIWSGLNLTQLPEKSGIDEINNIVGWSIPNGDISKVSNELEKAKSFLSSKKPNFSGARVSLKSLASYVKVLKEQMKMSEVKKVLENLKPLISFSNLMAIYDQGVLTPIVDVNNNKGISSDLKLLNDLSQDIPSVSLVYGIVSSRFIRHSQNYTQGLTNRHKDLERFEADASDEWFRKQFNSHISSGELKLLSGLKKGLADIETVWNAVATRNHYQSVRQIRELQKSISSVKTSVSDIENISSVFSGLCSLIPSERSAAKMKELTDKIHELTRKIDAFDALFSLVSEKEINLLDSVLAESSADQVQTVLTFLQSAKTQLDIFNDGISITETAKKIIENRLLVENFHENNAFKKYVNLFDCFKLINEDTATVARTAGLLVEIRTMTDGNTYTKHIHEISEAISNSKDLIRNVRSTFEDMKKKNISDKLRKMKDLQKFAKPFGEAVTVLLMMTKALDKISDFETFVKNGHNVEKLAIVSTLEIKDVIRRNWRTFEKVESQVKKLLKGLRQRETTLKIPKNTTSLTSFGPLFAVISGLPDVNLQAEDRLVAVEKLISDQGRNNIQPIKDLQTSLVELTSLDLQFTRFETSLKTVSGSMGKLEEILSGKEMTETTTVMEENTEEMEEQKITMWWVLVLIGSGLLLGIVVIVLICIGCGRTKKKKAQRTNRTTPSSPSQLESGRGSPSASDSNSGPEVAEKEKKTTKKKVAASPKKRKTKKNEKVEKKKAETPKKSPVSKKESSKDEAQMSTAYSETAGTPTSEMSSNKPTISVQTRRSVDGSTSSFNSPSTIKDTSSTVRNNNPSALPIDLQNRKKQKARCYQKPEKHKHRKRRMEKLKDDDRSSMRTNYGIPSVGE